jgi:hypothetical protein
MNCYYCHHLIKKVGTTDYGSPGVENFAQCVLCQVWHVYWNGQLSKVTTYFVYREENFSYHIDILNNKAIVYAEDKEGDNRVLCLDHIPNWILANLPEKFAKLVAFS